MTSERREYERISYTVSANYRVFLQKTLKKEELFYGQADIVNISGGGIQVRLSDVSSDLLDELLKSQKKLVLEFTLYIDDKPVKVHGKMAWAHEDTNTRAGICFVDTGASEQKLILDYIEQTLAQNEQPE